jgi:L-lactate dehydrogenase complex protein LldG
MNNAAREKILNRLHNAIKQQPAEAPPVPDLPVKSLETEDKIEKPQGLMEAVRTEVHAVEAGEWTGTLKNILKKRSLKTLLFAPETTVGQKLQQAWQEETTDLPELVNYAGDIEDFKEQLFTIDAAITSTMGGIAETGVVILWPDEKEPRLMSLVPPIHIAILEADKIHDTFSEAIEAEGWAPKMPTNVVLISGPSKTADIELTLAFGVHGPKELIVLILHNSMKIDENFL